MCMLSTNSLSRHHFRYTVQEIITLYSVSFIQLGLEKRADHRIKPNEAEQYMSRLFVCCKHANVKNTEIAGANKITVMTVIISLVLTVDQHKVPNEPQNNPLCL
mgnify:FL=1